MSKKLISAEDVENGDYEFEDSDEAPARPFAEARDDVGQLESIDSLLGDEGDRPAPKRRPRRSTRR